MLSPNPAPAASRGNLPTVQVLRGVAALMVSYLHLHAVSGYMAYLWPAYWPADIIVMARGVDIFFVISGFIMLVTSRSLTPKEFMKRRIIRIVPLYWWFTALIAVMATARPELFRTTVVTAEGLIKSLCFIPYLNPGREGEISPLLPPGWTLNYEMIFYVVFAAVLFAPLRYRVALCTAVFAALLVVTRATGANDHSVILQFYSDPILFEMVGGMVVGHAYLSKWTPSRSTCLLLIAFGFIAIITAALDAQPGNVLWRPIAYGLPACMLVLGGTMLDKVSGATTTWKIPAVLGDASYSIYLSHMFVLGTLRYLWNVLGLNQDTPWHAAAYAIVGMSAIGIAGVLCYYYIEKPMLALCKDAVGMKRKRSAVKAKVKANVSA